MKTSTTARPLELHGVERRCYNSTIAAMHRVHPELLVMRVVPDHGVPVFLPGQFTTLGLGIWEPGVSHHHDSDDESSGPRSEFDEGTETLLKRPYSIACSLLDGYGHLVRATDCPYLEFYIARVRQEVGTVHGLTPRLFALQAGARLFCGLKPTGHYQLPALLGSETMVFVATGTGEAPHNAMVAELLSRRFPGPIVSITCVRQRQDLAYLPAQRQLERLYPQYRYLYLTTREPENVDPQLAAFTGKRYLQEYFQSGDFERDAHVRLDPASTHVFLCGSPQMIGFPAQHRPRANSPVPGMISVLEERGFALSRPRVPGNIHTERYW